MVWLDAIDSQGNALYFDIHHVERQRRGRRWRHAVNGVCGNGLIEIDVLVEPDTGGMVTFIDLSADSDHDQAFLAIVDRYQLEAELLLAAEAHCSHRYTSKPVSSLSPYRYAQQVGYIAENSPTWRQVG